MPDKYPMWAYPRPFRDALYDVGAEHPQYNLTGYLGLVGVETMPDGHKVPKHTAMPTPEALDKLRQVYEKHGGQHWSDAITLVLSELATRGYVP